jgi:protoheme IX farnesyltransferase
MNFLVIVTTAVGFYLAMGPVLGAAAHWLLLVGTIAGTTLTAASASVLNQLAERRFDARMPRTRLRPLPTGRVTPHEALVFGIVLGVTGVSVLATLANPLTAALGLATLLLYVFVYTPLKRVTTLNTIVGAVPGAIPPMMGFTAAEGTLSAGAWVLFGVLFLWQMPHFLAIAALYRDDYAAGGFRMLPVVDTSLAMTCRMVLLYTLALIPVSLLAVPAAVSGGLYAVAALLLGGAFFVYGVRFWRSRSRGDARKLFFASIIYLPLLLGAMMIDKVG